MCDKELLVGYLYDDMAPGRAADDGSASAHVRGLPGRADGPARHPDDAERVDAADARPGVPVRPAGPAPAPRARAWTVSPAWGLAAAAVLVLSVASAIANVEVKYGPRAERPHRRGAHRPRRQPPPPASPVQTVSAPGEAELRRQLPTWASGSTLSKPADGDPAVLTSVHTPAAATGDLRAVRQLIADSENRQEQELARRISQVLRDVEGARRVDFDRTQRALAEVQGVVDTTIIRQREIENVLRVVHPSR